MRTLEVIFYLDSGKTQLNNMKKIISILIVFLIVFVTYFYYPNPLVVEKYETKIDSLNVEIQIKKDSIEIAENKINLLEDKVFFAEEKLEENKKKVKKIYEDYEVQIQTIDSYDIDQLEQFFSDRYQDSTSTQ